MHTGVSIRNRVSVASTSHQPTHPTYAPEQPLCEQQAHLGDKSVLGAVDRHQHAQDVAATGNSGGWGWGLKPPVLLVEEEAGAIMCGGVCVRV